MVFIPIQIFSQNSIECSSPGNCNGWLYHKNKIGIGTGWSESYIPRTTLHLHEFGSINTFLNITNQTTGFPTGSQNLGLFVGMMGEQAVISNFQNANLSLFTGNTERFTLTPDGKIGIGITTPATMLDVNGQITIRGGNPANNKILVSDANGTASWQTLQAGTGVTILGTTINTFWTKSGTYLYNNNNGNIGIGTVAPQNVLHLHKAVGTIPQINSADSSENRNISATSIFGLQVTNNSTGSSYNNGLLVGVSANGTAYLKQQASMSLIIGTNNSDAVNILPNGNVGIGTTASAKLHIKGTLRFESLTNATTTQNQKVLLVDASGNVSQAQPTLIGDNFGNHTATQDLKLNDYWLSNDGTAQGIKINNHGDVLIYGTPSNGTKTFEQNNGFEIVTRGRIPERRGISVDEDANGIPNGNINFWIHNWQNPAAFNFMRNDEGSVKKLVVINKNGQVGINVDNPQYTLHVSGNIRFEQLPQQQVITDETVLISDNQGIIKSSSASQLKDNLGNHTAVQNINLGNYWLSNDGSDKGLQIKSDGNVQVGSGSTQINIGKSYSNAPYYLSSYIGFNAQRNNQGQWLFQSDGLNNGGAAVISDVVGNLRFVTYKPTQGTTTNTLSESDLMANTQLLITSNKKIGLRTTNINADADVQIKGTTYVEDKMGIGICLGANNNPKGYRFAVNGTMGAKDVYIEVDETPWPDYVFEPEHRLMPLSDLEWYINKNKHLPDIPSANDIKENGLSLAEINAQLVKKVEELTLYIIELNKKIEKNENNK